MRRRSRNQVGAGEREEAGGNAGSSATQALADHLSVLLDRTCFDDLAPEVLQEKLDPSSSRRSGPESSIQVDYEESHRVRMAAEVKASELERFMVERSLERWRTAAPAVRRTATAPDRCGPSVPYRSASEPVSRSTFARADSYVARSNTPSRDFGK